MNIFVNPDIAYLLAVVAVMLAISTFLFPRANWPKVGMIICLVGAGLELFNLQANPWALVSMALCPLPYYVAARLPGQRRILLFVTCAMFVFGSMFLFVDQKGMPVVHAVLLFLVTIACAHYILVVSELRLNAQEIGRGIDPDNLVGLIGTTTTLVEDVGLVEVDGEIWSACSDHPIPAGNKVRVVKYQGRVLVVKKVEKMTGE